MEPHLKWNKISLDTKIILAAKKIILFHLRCGSVQP